MCWFSWRTCRLARWIDIKKKKNTQQMWWDFTSLCFAISQRWLMKLIVACSRWTWGSGNSSFSLGEKLFSGQDVSGHKRMVRPYCWRQRPHKSLDIQKLSWCLPRAITPCVHDTGRYSACCQRREATTYHAIKPLLQDWPTCKIRWCNGGTVLLFVGVTN